MTENQALGKYVLAIDLGTGGPKVGIVNEQGQVLCSASAPVQLFFLPDGGAEHNPAEWWSSISQCVKRVLDASPVPSEAIVAIGVTSFWSVTLPVDRNGEPLMNAMSWMDLRGASYNNDVIKGFPSVQGYQLGKLLKYLNLHGFAPTKNDALGHMLFIKYARPDIYSGTYKFFEPMDYINMRLTGKFAATQNTVLPMLLVDNRRLNNQEYDPWLVKTGGIDREKLPDLLPTDGVQGKLLPAIAQEWGLSAETVVICGVNDNCCSAVGAGSIGDAEPAAVMGTSGHMAFHVPFKKTDITHTVCTIPSGFTDSYLFWADLANNGKVYESFMKNFLFVDEAAGINGISRSMYERADKLAASVPPGSEGVLFLPWFNGSLSPGEDPYMRGGFLNLSHKTTRAHLVRALFEGLSMNWRWLRTPAEKLSRRRFQYWRLTGGGALSDIWCQIMADVVGLPMHRQADPRNNSVIGIGLLTFNRLGLVKLKDIPDMIKFDRVFEPDPKNRAIYDRMFAQFMSSKDKIRPVFHALNKA